MGDGRNRNPDNKRRSDGSLFGDRGAARAGKAYEANGKIVGKYREVGDGSKRLGARRIWRWLNGDDEN